MMLKLAGDYSDRMMLTLDDILGLVTAHSTRVLRSRTGLEYRLSIEGRSLKVIPLSTGTPRNLSLRELERGLEEFNRTGSTVTTPYSKFGLNKSYYLPLFEMARASSETSRAADAEPVASDRVEQIVARIVRDTRLAQTVKLTNAFRCQICDTCLDLGDGRLYAEAHHVRPLGSPHDGPDELENILCVCPNHHALLDYGAIRLDAEEFPSIREDHVRYHNDQLASVPAKVG